MRHHLRKQNIGAALIGTQTLGPEHARYDPEQSALASHATASAAATNGSVADHSEAVSKVDTFRYPPMELTLVQLHMLLADLCPDVPCARWSSWNDTMPASPRLADHEGCSMALRFLQHYIDSTESAEGG